MRKPLNTVAVHDGVFHADDTFAVAALLVLFPALKILRTRKPDVLATADLRVDVGGTYDAAAGTLDHHQPGGAGARANGIPFAGFGLTWAEFGRDVVESLCPNLADPDPEHDYSDEVEAVWSAVDRRLVQPVDAGDCGVKLSTGEAVEGVFPYGISSAISAFNPSWQETESFDSAFAKALVVAEGILRREVARAAGSVMAEAEVRKAIAAATDPRVIVLDQFVPWGDVVIDEAPEALYVVFPSETGDYRVQCVADGKGSFGKRKALPAAWGGKRGKDLAELTGVPDAIFCHPGLFIAGAQSKEGTLRLAQLALDA